MDNQSEVARLRERIDLEIEALQRIKDGFAIVASHKIIQHHYDKIGSYHQELVKHVGEEAATDVLCEGMNKIQ